MPETPLAIVMIDDDAVFRARFLRALHARGHRAWGTADGAEAIAHVREHGCDLCLLDLRMAVSGLTWIPGLRAAMGPAGILILLTGYGSIATAVEAMRLGASDYLTKPADVDQVLAACARLREAPRPDAHAVVPNTAASSETEPAPADAAYAVPSLDRVAWEHMQRVLQECGGNITQTARRLGLHRQSLQRKLAKRPLD